MSKEKPDPSVKQHPPHIRRVMEALKCRKHKRFPPEFKDFQRSLNYRKSREKEKKREGEEKKRQMETDGEYN